MDGRFRLSRATVAVTVFLAVLLLAISAGTLAAADDTTSTNADAQDVVHEQDWPMYRNDPPTQNGYQPNARPPTSDITEAWSFSHGPNPTSPIIYDDKLYVTNDAGMVQGRVGSSGFLRWDTYGARNPIGLVAVNGNIVTATNDPDLDRPYMHDDMKYHVNILDARTGMQSGVTGGYHDTITTGLAVDEPYHYCYNYRAHGGPTDSSACRPQDNHQAENEDTVTIGDIKYTITSENRDTTHLIAIKEHRYSGESIVWEFDLGVNPNENPHSSAVTVADHVAFVWGDTNEHGSGIHAIDIESGELLWHHPTPEEITGEVVSSDDNLYYTAGDRVYKLTGNSAPEPTPKPTSKPTDTTTRPPESTDAPIPTPDPQPTPEPTDTATPPTESTDAPIPTPDIPSPEPTPGADTPDSTDGQPPAQTPDSSIAFPDAQTPTSPPSAGSDGSPAQSETDAGTSLPDPSPATAGSNTPTAGQENSPDTQTNSRTETQPTTNNQGDITLGTDAAATETPVADSAVSDADSDASAPPPDSTATNPDSEPNVETGDSTSISTESMQEDQTGFGPLVALLAILGSILIAYRRT